MSAAESAARVRRGVGCFERRDRGLLRVTGSDRVRWSQGMLSNDVAGLAPDPERSGCYALLLTPQGRIVADIHVLCREEELWFELAATAVADVQQRLERFVIAEDVALEDIGGRWLRLALEGPRAPEVLARALGAAASPERDCAIELGFEGAPLLVAAWGSSEAARQLFASPAQGDALRRALADAAGSLGVDWVIGDAATAELLRIEAGLPQLGAELGLDVLPAEAGLIGRAVSLSKGCYTGQEIVARMDSRGAVAHRLVGFRIEAPEGELPEVGSAVCVGDKRVGELTSVGRSAEAGAIGLGFVRTRHAEIGTSVTIAGRSAHLAERPFVATAS